MPTGNASLLSRLSGNPTKWSWCCRWIPSIWRLDSHRNRLSISSTLPESVRFLDRGRQKLKQCRMNISKAEFVLDFYSNAWYRDYRQWNASPIILAIVAVINKLVNKLKMFIFIVNTATSFFNFFSEAPVSGAHTCIRTVSMLRFLTLSSLTVVLHNVMCRCRYREP